MNRTVLRACSKQFDPSANLRTNPAATKASKVLPVSIPNDLPHEPCVVMLTRKGPNEHPGHRPIPQKENNRKDNAGGRPARRGAPIYNGEGQAEFTRKKVNRRDSDDRRQRL